MFPRLSIVVSWESHTSWINLMAGLLLNEVSGIGISPRDSENLVCSVALGCAVVKM